MRRSDKITLIDAISISIGGMVGGGIFAVLGLSVVLAKGGTPVAFLLAGSIAMLTAISYAKLSTALPSSGGTVHFINKAFGVNVFSGGTNNLLWFSYIIMLSLYSTAFGSYAPNLFEITGDVAVDQHLYISGVILLATAINYISTALVGRIESVAVFVKLIILLGFVAVGAYGLIDSQYLSQLKPDTWESPLNLLAAGMVIFVAYEGFELVANASPNIIHPEKNIKKAFLYSVGFVILLYIVIAIITVGSLSFPDIRDAADYVLAEAAKPTLGQAGFVVITIAALISTFSAINATVFGGSRVNYKIAERDELPHEFTYKLWNHPVGLAVTCLLTLLIANLLDLHSISISGSAGFLFIFAVVNLSAIRLRQVKGNPWLPGIGLVVCSIAFIVLLVQQVQGNLKGTLISLGIIAFSYVVEWVYKSYEKF